MTTKRKCRGLPSTSVKRGTSTMMRLYCFSAAGAAMGSSESRDDRVDVVTLGAMQPPLAGQARPSGSNTVGKGGRDGYTNVVDGSERPEDTLERLLRRTLDSALQSTLLEKEQKESTAGETPSAAGCVVSGLGDIEQGHQDKLGEVEQQSEASATSDPNQVREHDDDGNDPGDKDGKGLKKEEIQVDVSLKQESQGQGELDISTSWEAQHPEETPEAAADEEEDEDYGSDVIGAGDGMMIAASDHPTANLILPAHYFASDDANRSPLVDTGVDRLDATAKSTQESRDVPLLAVEPELIPLAAASSSDDDSDGNSALVTEDVAFVSTNKFDVLEEKDGRGVGGAEIVATALTESSSIEGEGETSSARRMAGPTNVMADEADSRVHAESATLAGKPTGAASLDMSEAGKVPGTTDEGGGRGYLVADGSVEGYSMSVGECAVIPESVKIREQFSAADGIEEPAGTDGSPLPHPPFDTGKEVRCSSSDAFAWQQRAEEHAEALENLPDFAWQQRHEEHAEALENLPDFALRQRHEEHAEALENLPDFALRERHEEHAEAPENLSDNYAPLVTVNNTSEASTSADAAETATSHPDELGRSEPGDPERPGGANRGPRKFPMFGKPMRSGGIDGKASELTPGKLPSSLDDPESWGLPPFSERMDDIFPSNSHHAAGKETPGGAVAEAEGTVLWWKWGKICIRKTEAVVGQWLNVAGKKGAVWSAKILEVCKTKVEEFWRDHLREPVEQKLRRLEEAWRFVLAEIVEYMADPALAELV